MHEGKALLHCGPEIRVMETQTLRRGGAELRRRDERIEEGEGGGGGEEEKRRKESKKNNDRRKNTWQRGPGLVILSRGVTKCLKLLKSRLDLERDNSPTC